MKNNFECLSQVHRIYLILSKKEINFNSIYIIVFGVYYYKFSINKVSDLNVLL